MHKINLNIDENVNEVLGITINNQDFDNYRTLDIQFISQTPSFPLYLIRIPEVQFSINTVDLHSIWFHRNSENWGMSVTWSEIKNFYNPNMFPIIREFHLDNDKDYNIHIHVLNDNNIRHTNARPIIYIDIS